MLPSAYAASATPTGRSRERQGGYVAAPPVHAAVATAVAVASTSAAAVAPPLAASPAAPMSSTEGPQAVAVRLGFTPFKVPEAVAGETYLTALTQSLWGRIAVLFVSGLLGLVGVLGIWRLVNRQPAVIAKTNDDPERIDAALDGFRDQSSEDLAGRDRSSLVARGDGLRTRSASFAHGPAANARIVGAAW